MAIFTHAAQPLAFHFPGVAEIDTASTELRLKPIGSGEFHIIRAEITGCSDIVPGVAGITTVTTSLSSMGAGFSVSVSSAQRQNTADASPGLEFSAPTDYVYVRRSAAGGHCDVRGVVWVSLA